MGNVVKPAAESANYSPSAYREALKRIGVVVSFTKGVSMRPLIWTGKHYVAIVPVKGEPQIGDILLFEQIRRGETACILHRLIGIQGDCHVAKASRNDERTGASRNDEKMGDSRSVIYITRGDNCLGVEKIRREDIIGRVETIYRSGRWSPCFALGAREIHMTDPRYLRYVERWNRSWPLRRQAYRFRSWLYLNPFSQKILKPIYHFLKP